MDTKKNFSLLDNEDTGSILNDNNSLLGGSLLDEGPSLLDGDDNPTIAELNSDVAQIEARKRFFLNPKNQADILLQNYIRNQPVLVNRKTRQAVYAQYLRDANKGKFNKLFHDSIYGIDKADAASKISKLNS
jgi:hypothetical protein